MSPRRGKRDTVFVNAWEPPVLASHRRPALDYRHPPGIAEAIGFGCANVVPRSVEWVEGIPDQRKTGQAQFGYSTVNGMVTAISTSPHPESNASSRLTCEFPHHRAVPDRQMEEAVFVSGGPVQKRRPPVEHRLSRKPRWKLTRSPLSVRSLLGSSPRTTKESGPFGPPTCASK